MVVNDDWPITTVTVAADNSRQTLDDLVDDLNDALARAGVSVHIKET